MKNLNNLRNLAKNLSILYVEDNEEARKKTSFLLSKIFDKVDIASNGKEGLIFYVKNKYDLIISDIVMNDINGLEMIKAIKNVNKNQRVMFLSAYTNTEFLVDAIELGVDEFVFKPIDLDILFKHLEKILIQINNTKENLIYKNNLEELIKKRTSQLLEKNEELENMIKEIKKSKLLEEEMILAKTVQMNFLPKQLPLNTSMEIATFFEAAKYVGGDYYDIFESSFNSINIIIADVSGHGIAPAITMSSFRGICRAIFSLNIDFEEQIFLINNMMCEDAKNNDFFITAFFIKYYEKEDYFKYISAGHNTILYYNTKNKNLEYLKSTNIPLGIFKNTNYKSENKNINTNDLLVLYTDGLIEAFNKNKEMFSLNRLINIILKNKELSCNEILEDIKKELSIFLQNESITDDTTILLTKFL